MVCVICSVVNFTAMHMYIAQFYVLNVILHRIGWQDNGFSSRNFGGCHYLATQSNVSMVIM